MDGKVVIGTLLDNKGLEKGIKNITGKLGGFGKIAGRVSLGITAAFGAAATAIAAVTTQAVRSYADFEQLAGGVETLFKGSADKVKAYAEDAFYTAGMSANEYMETVTGFSASLISGLAGDTDKAADVANMALKDMSDNANKMGTSMESIKNAYQGFAKQNYTLLDNLKLGYGGTKTEMERLLRDAQAITGVAYNINNLADVYNAIHAIQEKLDIAGTTAKEAEKTISGSAAMTAAAWKNVLTAIAGGGDIDKAINNLVFSISRYFENIVPVVERSLAGVGQLIERVAPTLVQTVARSFIKAIPSLLDAAYKMILGLASGIYQGFVALFTGGPGAVKALQAQIRDVADAANAAASAEENLADGITEAAKAAKKSLAGFDELNILQSGTAAQNPADAPSAGGFAVNVPVSTEGNISDQISPQFDSLISKIKAFAKRIRAVFAPIFAKIMPAAIKAFSIDFEGVSRMVTEACGWLGSAFDGVKTVFSDMCASISEKWSVYGDGLISGFLAFKESLWGIWWNIYDDIIAPVLTNIAYTFTWLWDEHLKPLWDGIVEFVMSVSENIMTLWNGFLAPLINWIIERVAPTVVMIKNGIVDAVAIVISVVSDTVKNILKYIDGLIQFITGVFTLDWARAWGGIVKMFEGVWGQMESIITGAVNAIIWVINQLIAAIYTGISGVINGLSGVVETVGNVIGQNWSFSIPTTPPKIPYLAQGAVLPPNKPFMAMVGDQRHGTNIEAPLATIQEAVALVMQDQTDAILAGFESSVGIQREILEAVLGIQIGDDVIGRATARYNQKLAIARGGTL